MMTSQQIRQQFIDFFVQKHGHAFVPSSSVVPLDDPTLLFTNAGMNQFKPYFLGQAKAPWPGAVNSQKCIRAGGKHNDLDDVGRSRRHHTFFEMLGNWSFGDYFKRGAIEMAWELLTGVFKLDPTRLHASCYEGNSAAGIPRDSEAADLWKEIAGLPDERIHFFGKDNFWEMGETGPCGPCSEIYMDRTPDKTGGKDVNGEDPRVMEIWNLVFIQYNRDEGGKLTTLPAQHVDTGMGLERLCQVLQQKDDNYGTDIWAPLFQRISEISSLRYTGSFPKTNVADPIAEAADAQLRHDIAFRVIADHIRCLTFALTDGAIPSNEGRGYVLRRILRRAVRFGRQQLSLREPFLYQLVPVIVDTMGSAFPELRQNPQRVADIVREEEASFARTIDRGIDLFEEAANRAKENSHRQLVVSGQDAFDLHATYGFPIDLTGVMAAERGMVVDVQGYQNRWEEHQRISNARQTATAGIANLPPDVIAELSRRGVAPTDDAAKFHHAPVQSSVKAIWQGQSLLDSVPATPPHLSGSDPDTAAQRIALILEKTNFYAEMGGQVGDSGELRTHTGTRFAVETTRNVGPFVLHIGQVEGGRIQVGQVVTALVQGGRQSTEKNHTITHIANWALREVLGESVQQKGSLVDPEKLRFDFAHGKALNDDELAKVEALVNERIARGLTVYAEVAPQEQALKIHSLRAVFGEKYPPMVRVVSIGVPVKDLLADPENARWRQFSIEFCGGTHLENCGQACGFVLLAEESVSKGVRRIVAVTGNAALQAASVAHEMETLIAQTLETGDANLGPIITNLQKCLGGIVPLRAKRRGQAALSQLQTRLRAFEKLASKSQSTNPDYNLSTIVADSVAGGIDVEGGKLIVVELPDSTDDQMRSVLDSLRKKVPTHGVLLAIVLEGQVSFVAAVSEDWIARGLKAGDWIKETTKAAGGNGGGRPQMAMGSAKDPARLPVALDAARVYAQQILSKS